MKCRLVGAAASFMLLAGFNIASAFTPAAVKRTAYVFQRESFEHETGLAMAQEENFEESEQSCPQPESRTERNENLWRGSHQQAFASLTVAAAFALSSLVGNPAVSIAASVPAAPAAVSQSRVSTPAVPVKTTDPASVDLKAVEAARSVFAAADQKLIASKKEAATAEQADDKAQAVLSKAEKTARKAKEDFIAANDKLSQVRTSTKNEKTIQAQVNKVAELKELKRQTEATLETARAARRETALKLSSVQTVQKQAEKSKETASKVLQTAEKRYNDTTKKIADQEKKLAEARKNKEEKIRKREQKIKAQAAEAEKKEAKRRAEEEAALRKKQAEAKKKQAAAEAAQKKKQAAAEAAQKKKQAEAQAAQKKKDAEEAKKAAKAKKDKINKIKSQLAKLEKEKKELQSRTGTNKALMKLEDRLDAVKLQLQEAKAAK